jgi:hypothetical protein
MDTWSGGSMGTDLLSYIKESQTAPKEPGPISVWDCQFQAAGWHTAAAWQALHKVKLTNRIPTAVAEAHPEAIAAPHEVIRAALVGAKISLEIPRDGSYGVKLYDVRGKLVSTMYDGPLSKGTAYVSLPGTRTAPGGYIVDIAFRSGHSRTMIAIK